MPLLNMSEAARAAGVSRGQLYRLVESGRISATKRPNGQQGIDTAELLRVFGALQGTGQADRMNSSRPSGAGQLVQQETVRRVSELEAEVRRLTDVLRLTERMLQTAEDRLRQADAERAQLMLLLPMPTSRQLDHQPVTPAAAPAPQKTVRRVAAKKAKVAEPVRPAPARKTAAAKTASRKTPARKTRSA